MSTKEKNADMLYTYGSLAFTFFILALLIKSVFIPFILVSVAFGWLALSESKKAEREEPRGEDEA